jgi:hypothetical protein
MPTTLTPPDLTRLPAMLTRLKLTAVRDQLDTLLGEAARRELTLAETLAFLCPQWTPKSGHQWTPETRPPRRAR